MAQHTPSSSFLNAIERVGNKLPDITMLFLYALVVCWALSLGLSFIDFDYTHPLTGDRIEIVNMLSYQELVTFTTSMVKNFINFPPLGITIVATLGIGIAEGSGFIHVLLKKLLNITPQKILTPAVIFVGIVSHMASDSAYVILMPVSAMMFYACGRHPLAGIAAAFAGLAGGFTASYTPSIIDPIMQGFTQGAARIMDPSYDVNVLCNYFFSIGGTFGVIAVCWWITDKIVEPRLKVSMPLNDDLSLAHDEDLKKVTPEESRAFRLAGLAMLAMLLGLGALLYPENSLLRAPNGSLTSPQAPVMQAIVPLLFLMFTIPGIIFGFSVKKYRNSKDVTQSMEGIIKSLISFIVFGFFCAQFLYAFGRSNIGTLIAISGADFLKSLAMPAGITVFGIIMLTAALNIIITSASSKWAILAPVFVPMLMAVGISPELTQAAFRVSDSAINVSTPMFAFYPLILMYCQQYCKKAGIGTLCSMMIPYSIGLLVVLTATLYLFWGLDIPLGFQSGYVYPPAQ